MSKSTTTLLEEFVGLFRIGGCLNLYRLFEFSFVATECLGGHQLPIKNHCVITLHHRLHFCQDQMPRSCINSFRDLLCHSMLPVCLGGHQLPIKNRLCQYITSKVALLSRSNTPQSCKLFWGLALSFYAPSVSRRTSASNKKSTVPLHYITSKVALLSRSNTPQSYKIVWGFALSFCATSDWYDSQQFLVQYIVVLDIPAF